jgi:hypothetical protein
MKGTLEDGLPSESSTRPYGSFNTIWKVLASTALYSLMKSMNLMPIVSRLPQRWMEEMQSSEVTGLPSCHSRPSRNVKVQVSLSGDTSYLSTICGFTALFSSDANSVS